MLQGRRRVLQARPSGIGHDNFYHALVLGIAFTVHQSGPRQPVNNRRNRPLGEIHRPRDFRWFPPAMYTDGLQDKKLRRG